MSSLYFPVIDNRTVFFMDVGIFCFVRLEMVCTVQTYEVEKLHMWKTVTEAYYQ